MRLPTPIVSAIQVTQEKLSILLRRPSWQYEIVNDNEKDSDRSPAAPSRLSHCLGSLRAPHKYVLSTVTILTLFATIIYTISSWKPAVRWQPNRHQQHMMRFLLPDAVADGESCKTLASAITLGYPVPEIINYNQTLEEAGKESERERSKIKLLSDYFSKVSTASNNDVAVVLDTPFSWVQLRAEVLLSRYFEMNHAADEVLRNVHSYEDVTTRGVRQTTIISAGGFKDGNVFNVGTIVGTVASMRALYREANARAIKTIGDVSSVSILAEIYAQQQLQRQVLLQRRWSWPTRIWRAIFSGASTDNIGAEDEDFEFGIGLDMDGKIGLPIENQHDFDWTTPTSQSRGYSYISRLPEDVAQSMPPFWTPSGTHPRAGSGWDDVSLLRDKTSGAIPVLINFPWKLSRFQRADWTNFWLQPHMKALRDESLTVPRLPVASVVEPNGIEHTFWDASVRFDRDGVRTVEGMWAPWKDLCEKAETWVAADT